MPLYDLWRPKAPPPDEQPAEPFPHVFLTPRALRDIAVSENKRGRMLVALVTKSPVPEEKFTYLLTPYGNLVHKECVRVTCPEVPAYATREVVEQFAIFVIDHVPLPNDPPGTRTLNNPIYGEIPFPTGAVASDPGLLRLSFEKLARLHPEIVVDSGGSWDGLGSIALLVQHMLFGDSNPALVAAVEPELLVAAYSGDIDCVVLLRFPREFATDYRLKPGMRLISVNTYRDDEQLAPDLIAGPKYTNWTNYSPFIAEFLADDPERLAALHASMPEWSWQRCRELTVAALKRRPLRPRDGRPLRSVKPVV